MFIFVLRMVSLRVTVNPCGQRARCPGKAQAALRRILESYEKGLRIRKTIIVRMANNPKNIGFLGIEEPMFLSEFMSGVRSI
jgi:hypothetical protein